jgi:tetratricopeptide (TPR) repeat protein
MGKSLLISGFLVLAVVGVFGQTVRHDFVNYDDNKYVYKNPQVTKGGTIAGLAWAFTSRQASNWHPLTWLSHMLDGRLYGLAPGGHHVTNIVLHAVTAILLFLVLWRATGDRWPSAFVAAVFAVHPLRAESVAWVAERKDVLSGLLFVLALGAYVGYVRRPFSLFRYLTLMAIFCLGLMAKPMLVTLPLVLLLLDYWPLGRMTPPQGDGGLVHFSARRRALRINGWPKTWTCPLFAARTCLWEKVPLLVLSAASCAATLWAQHEAMEATAHRSLASRIGNAAVAYAGYLDQLFYPVGLAVHYPYPETGPGMWKVAGAVLVLLAISSGVLIGRRRCPYLLVGWLWYVGMLIPVSGLVAVGSQAMADRFTYLPQIGLGIALAWGATDLTRSWPGRGGIRGAAAMVLMALMLACAWRQTCFWRDSETLWRHALACTTGNSIAHYNLGVALADGGRADAAIVEYRNALQVRPDYPEAHYNLGVILAGRGEIDEAMVHYGAALKTAPDFSEAHHNLGSALAGRGRLDEAILHYRQALAIMPDFAEAHNNLANALAARGRVDQAIAHYRRALEIMPDFAEAHNNLGSALARQGRSDEASRHYQRALAIKPDYAEAHNNLGAALQERGKIAEAIAHYEKAVAIMPNYAEAHNNLGAVLGQQGRLSEAIAHFRKALELNPGHEAARRNLGIALGQRDSIPDAPPR